MTRSLFSVPQAPGAQTAVDDCCEYPAAQSRRSPARVHRALMHHKIRWLPRGVRGNPYHTGHLLCRETGKCIELGKGNTKRFNLHERS